MLHRLRSHCVIATALLVGGCSAAGTSGVAVAPPIPVTRPMAQQNGGGQWIEENLTYITNPVVGFDGHIWSMPAPDFCHDPPLSGGEVVRVAPGTFNRQIFCVPGPTLSLLSAGIDRMWYCYSFNVIALDRNAGYVEYPNAPLQQGTCASLALGTDGNMWAVDGAQPQLLRVTPTGGFKIYPLPDKTQIPTMLVGAKASRLVWFLGSNASGWFAGHIDPASGSIASYQISKSPKESLGPISSGIDGNAYVEIGAKGQVIRVTPSGAINRFDVGAGDPSDQSQHDVSTIWMLKPPKDLVGWTVPGHVATDYGQPDTSAPSQMILGPDQNVWGQYLIYVRRVMTLTPSSVTLSIGKQQPVTIAELKCRTCSWAASSTDPSIATVSVVSGDSFTVTAVGAGSTSVTVNDRRGNQYVLSVQVE